MKKANLHISVVLMLLAIMGSLLLIGCDSGLKSHNQANSQNGNNDYKDSDFDNPPEGFSVGYLKPIPIEGLTFVVGKNEPKRTGPKGQYFYKNGTAVQFFFAGLLLGEEPGSQSIELRDLLQVTAENSLDLSTREMGSKDIASVNLFHFLFTIDSNGLSDGRLSISEGDSRLLALMFDHLEFRELKALASLSDGDIHRLIYHTVSPNVLFTSTQQIVERLHKSGFLMGVAICRNSILKSHSQHPETHPVRHIYERSSQGHLLSTTYDFGDDGIPDKRVFHKISGSLRETLVRTNELDVDLDGAVDFTSEERYEDGFLTYFKTSDSDQDGLVDKEESVVYEPVDLLFPSRRVLKHYSKGELAFVSEETWTREADDRLRNLQLYDPHGDGKFDIGIETLYLRDGRTKIRRLTFTLDSLNQRRFSSEEEYIIATGATQYKVKDANQNGEKDLGDQITDYQYNTQGDLQLKEVKEGGQLVESEVFNYVYSDSGGQILTIKQTRKDSSDSVLGSVVTERTYNRDDRLVASVVSTYGASETDLLRQDQRWITFDDLGRMASYKNRSDHWLIDNQYVIDNEGVYTFSDLGFVSSRKFIYSNTSAPETDYTSSEQLSFGACY